MAVHVFAALEIVTLLIQKTNSEPNFSLYSTRTRCAYTQRLISSSGTTVRLILCWKIEYSGPAQLHLSSPVSPIILILKSLSCCNFEDFLWQTSKDKIMTFGRHFRKDYFVHGMEGILWRSWTSQLATITSSQPATNFKWNLVGILISAWLTWLMKWWVIWNAYLFICPVTGIISIGHEWRRFTSWHENLHHNHTSASPSSSSFPVVIGRHLKRISKFRLASGTHTELAESRIVLVLWSVVRP